MPLPAAAGDDVTLRCARRRARSDFFQSLRFVFAVSLTRAVSPPTHDISHKIAFVTRSFSQTFSDRLSQLRDMRESKVNAVQDLSDYDLIKSLLFCIRWPRVTLRQGRRLAAVFLYD